MDRDVTRKLIAALAAILSGGSTYFGAKQEEEDRRRKEEDRLADRAMRERNMALNERWYARSEEQDKLRRAEAERAQADEFNTGQIERAAQLAGDRSYTSVRDTAGIQMAGDGGKRVASESLPLITGDGTLDLDLTNRINRLRAGGSMDRSGAVAEVGTRAREDAASRTAGLQRDIGRSVAIEEGTRGARVATAEAMAGVQDRHERGPAGPSAADIEKRNLGRVFIDAQREARTAGSEHELQTRMLQRYPQPDYHPLDVMGAAIDAWRERQKYLGGLDLFGIAREGGFGGGGGRVAPASSGFEPKGN